MNDEELTRHCEDFMSSTQDDRNIAKLERRLRIWQLAFWSLVGLCIGFWIRGQ